MILMAFYYFHPKRNGTRVILSMSAKEPGRYQITYFVYSQRTDMFIPWSDSIRNSIRACLKQLDEEGFQREKHQRFDMFEKPDTLVPTRVYALSRSDKQHNRFLLQMGLDSEIVV